MMDYPDTIFQGLTGYHADVVRSRDNHFASVRGQIVGVTSPDSEKNVWGVTVVDVSIGSFYATTVYNVPLLSPHANIDNGEYWSPEVGDRVLVGFIDGMFRDPIVYGCLSRASSVLEPNAAEYPWYKKVLNSTSEMIGKDGTRRIHVAHDDVLEIVGDGTVTIGGNLSVTVTGNATIDVTGTALVKSDAVQLGSDTNIQKLIDERILAYYDQHTHSVPGITSGPNTATSAVPTVPLTPLVSGIATTKTKAA